jgi:hypothetical protein
MCGLIVFSVEPFSVLNIVSRVSSVFHTKLVCRIGDKNIGLKLFDEKTKSVFPLADSPCEKFRQSV